MICKECNDAPDGMLQLLMDVKQQSIQYTITKIITKHYLLYFCDQYNTSYPNISLVLDDHPNFDQTNFIILDKRKGHGAPTPFQDLTQSIHQPTKYSRSDME